MYELMFFRCRCVLRAPGMEVRQGVFFIVALDEKMLSRFDLLLLCTNHKLIRRDYSHKGESFEHGCCCATAAVLLVYCCVLIRWMLA